MTTIITYRGVRALKWVLCQRCGHVGRGEDSTSMFPCGCPDLEAQERLSKEHFARKRAARPIAVTEWTLIGEHFVFHSPSSLEG